MCVQKLLLHETKSELYLSKSARLSEQVVEGIPYKNIHRYLWNLLNSKILWIWEKIK